MSERSPFSPSGLLARSLAFAARKSPKGLNVIFAAGYGICEVLGAQALLSTLWPLFQSQLKERLSATSKDTDNHKQGIPEGAGKAVQGNLPKRSDRLASGPSSSASSTGHAK